jgi:hypothetical protein
MHLVPAGAQVPGDNEDILHHWRIEGSRDPTLAASTSLCPACSSFPRHTSDVCIAALLPTETLMRAGPGGSPLATAPTATPSPLWLMWDLSLARRLPLCLTPLVSVQQQ